MTATRTGSAAVGAAPCGSKRAGGPRRQRGVAVVTALLLTALSVTLVTGIFWQQQILVRGMEGQRLRLQGKLIVRAALDAACLALREAAAQSNVTTLDGAWTAPLMEDGLERYLGQGAAQGAEQGQGGGETAEERRAARDWSGRAAGDGGSDRLTQRIFDAQSRFNLRNLASPKGVDSFQTAAFARLLASLTLDSRLAYRIAEAIAPRGGAVSAPASGEQMEIQQLDDLRAVPGLGPATLERLRDFVTVLPEPTAINVNTASAEVLTSVANLSLQDARALVAQRRQAYFTDASNFALRLNNKETLEGVNYQVSSDYFLVDSSLTLDRSNLRTQALIRRRAKLGPGAALVWLRED